MDLVFDKPFIVLDLEATCCDKGTVAREDMEIIQIGACLILPDDPSIVVNEFNSYVKPNIHPTLTSFCTNLTGITQAQVDCASSYNEVYSQFVEWAGDSNDYYLCSWGAYDKNQLIKDCKRAELEYTLGEHYNLKEWFAYKMRCKQMGLSRALGMFNMPFEGNHHSAIDDARNTVRVFNRCLEHLAKRTLKNQTGVARFIRRK